MASYIGTIVSVAPVGLMVPDRALRVSGVPRALMALLLSRRPEAWKLILNTRCVNSR
jgi:hypothetical protein